MSANPREFDRLKRKLRDAVFHDPRLTRTQQRIGYEIADFLNHNTGYAWPSQEIIAQRAHCSVKTVERATAKMDGLWFTREIVGSNYRYIPKFDRLTQPDTRQNVGYRHPTFVTKTPDIRDQNTRQNVGLSSLRDPNKGEPTGVCGQVGDPPTSPQDQVVERGTTIAPWQQSRDRWRTAAAKLNASVAADKANEGTDSGAVQDAIPLDQEITAQAVCGGAPRFVFEGSKPWRAWVEYRARIGIPGQMPVRRHMVNGRWRSGWDAPTLYPPGYRGPKSRSRG